MVPEKIPTAEVSINDNSGPQSQTPIAGIANLNIFDTDGASIFGGKIFVVVVVVSGSDGSPTTDEADMISVSEDNNASCSCCSICIRSFGIVVIAAVVVNDDRRGPEESSLVKTVVFWLVSVPAMVAKFGDAFDEDDDDDVNLVSICSNASGGILPSAFAAAFPDKAKIVLTSSFNVVSAATPDVVVELSGSIIAPHSIDDSTDDCSSAAFVTATAAGGLLSSHSSLPTEDCIVAEE